MTARKVCFLRKRVGAFRLPEPGGVYVTAGTCCGIAEHLLRGPNIYVVPLPPHYAAGSILREATGQHW